MPPVICPRSAILHKRRGVERGFDLGIDCFNCREKSHLWLWNSQGMGEVDGVLHDVNFIFEFRLDIDGGVGD